MATSLFIHEAPLLVIPSLAVSIGLNEALILQQFHYLGNSGNSGRIINGERWVYDTYEELQRKFFPFWSLNTIKRTIAGLENSGWLLSCQPEGSVSRRKYYRVSAQSYLYLTSERLSDAKKTRTTQIEPFDDPSCYVPLTETSAKTSEPKEPMSGQVPTRCLSRALNGKPLPPVWTEVEKHAISHGIARQIAVRFWKLNDFYGWRTNDRPIRNWKLALDQFAKVDGKNTQKQDKTTNNEFWTWAREEFADEEMDLVGIWVRTSTKNGWRKPHKITGEMEPIGDYRKCCRAFVDECLDMNLLA